jgi:RpiB/LacA/LacB family sugar-phosphate isomerase
MTIYLGADHRGFNLKEKLKAILTNEAYDVVDLGAAAQVPDDDYPDYARAVADVITKDPDGNRGILICGSGFGMEVAANKFHGVRAVLPMSPDHAYVSRHDDNANILVIAADFTDEAAAQKIVKTFLSTSFDREERYLRRIGKITASEG